LRVATQKGVYVPYKNGAWIGLSRKFKEYLDSWRRNVDPKMSWEDFLTEIFTSWHEQKIKKFAR
jgi:hypothetical protein